MTSASERSASWEFLALVVSLFVGIAYVAGIIAFAVSWLRPHHG